MRSITEFSYQELLQQIEDAKEDLETAEYNTGDYNSALAELQVAQRELKARDKQNRYLQSV